MARTTGPLLSMDASGSVGNSITFAKWKGRNYVRRYAIPSNPKTTGQTSIRTAMQFYTSIYKANTSAVEAAFEAEAQSKKISPFNAFISAAMKAWKSSVMLEPDGTEIGSWTSSANITLAGTAQPRGITWSWAESESTSPVAWLLLVRAGADPGSTTQYAVFGSASAASYLLSGLEGSTSYQARVAFLGVDGVFYYKSTAVTVATP